MFVLIAVLCISGLADHPTVVVHDFKTQAACEKAGAVLEAKTEASGMARASWECVPK